MFLKDEDRERWAEIVRLEEKGDLFRDNEEERARTRGELEYFEGEYGLTLAGDLCGNCGARASLGQSCECGGGSLENPYSKQSVDAAIDRMKADEAKATKEVRVHDILPLSELEDEYLEAIVRCAKTGGNELAQREAREAQAILSQRQAQETA